MTGIKPLFIMYHPGNLIRDLLVTYKKKYLEIEDYFTKYITVRLNLKIIIII